MSIRFPKPAGNSLIPLRRAALCCWLLLHSLPGAACVAGADPPKQESVTGTAWQRHTVDGSSRGADGVRLADINSDGLPDIVTGWEEGGQIRLALHPGFGKVRELWPSVTIGRVKSPEDAVFFDADRDGRLDVVSSCEGGTKSLFVHWCPADSRQLLQAEAWATARVPASHGRQRWMYAVPVELDGQPGQELVTAGKGENAEIGWWQLPEKSRELADWKWHPIDTVGWVMSIEPLDVDLDGDTDLLVTDRRGRKRGLWWFDNPGAEADNQTAITSHWPRRPIGGQEREVMFLAVGDLDGDRHDDILTVDQAGAVLWYRRDSNSTGGWQEIVIPFPANTGTGKGIAVADLNLDGRADLVLTCERAGGKSGVFWLTRPAGSSPDDPRAWTAREISGQSANAGVKFDLIQLLDLDGDGDLDLLTCEERDNLGVIWYENPTR